MVLRQGDYVFLEAESGQEALEIMERQKVDLLILDLMMPHQNGFDVIVAMRKSETLARIPFIVASASTAQDDIQRSLELGAIDYFTKPLSECDIRFQIPLKVRNAIALHQATDERLRIERMKAVSAMAVALNHEINNPLQVIQGNAQLLHVHPGLPDDARDKVTRIRAAAETVTSLTQRIAALRDIVTVDYPAGNKSTVPMVNFEASAAAGKKP
jgi:CheY-like chemotaxis protein